MSITVTGRTKIAVLGLALLAVTAGPSMALNYVLGSGWQSLAFEVDVPAPFGAGQWGGTIDNPLDPFTLWTFNAPWNFTLSAPSIFKIADVGDKGDFYRIWDSSAEIAVTPSVALDMSTEMNPDVTFGGPWSWASFTLGAGAHSLNFQDVLYADGTLANLPTWFQGAADAYFRVDPIPEPGTLGLLGLGLGVSGLLISRRRRV